MIRRWGDRSFDGGKLLAGLITLGCVAAACGSGSPSPYASVKVEGGTSAQTFAAAAYNLRVGDLPSAWTKEPQGSGPNVVRDSLNNCTFSTAGSSSAAASAVSSNFLDRSTGQEVGSQVRIFNSADEAASSAKIAASSSVSGCMAPGVRSGLQGTLTKTEKLRNVTVEPVRPVGTGTGTNGFAQRMAAVISFLGRNKKTQSTTVYVEVVGFSRGTALVEVEFEDAGSPPPKTLVAKTMELLNERAGTK